MVKEQVHPSLSLRILNFGGDVLDTRSATGKLILTMFAGFAEFERNLISERTKEGMKRAKGIGKRGPDKIPRKRRGGAKSGSFQDKWSD